MELASYGFLILSPNYQDGSCEYTEGPFEWQNGKRVRKQLYFDSRYENNHFEFRSAGLKIRVTELRALIDEVCKGTFFDKHTLDSEFGQATIDTTNLVCMGHSYGGITSIYAQTEDKRIRGAIGLDPWFFPCYPDLQSGKVGITDPNQATSMQVTERFVGEYPYASEHDAYDRKGQFAKFISNSNNVGRQQSATMLG
jgi:hypothetical protein